MVTAKSTDHVITMTAKAYDDLCDELGNLVWCDACGLLMSVNEPDEYEYQVGEDDTNIICVRCQ